MGERWYTGESIGKVYGHRDAQAWWCRNAESNHRGHLSEHVVLRMNTSTMGNI
jgi:hypothetical protein